MEIVLNKNIKLFIDMKHIFEKWRKSLNEGVVGEPILGTDPATADVAGSAIYSRAHEVDLRDSGDILQETETMLVEMGNWISSELRKDGGGDVELLRDLNEYVERLAHLNEVLLRKHYQ